ncbi:hypothetical protein Taro_053517 [Colocasia esculenta]|uniref:LOB domain-containing protein n=1 Tax=Colocasia esculenta TaxID=4460 RepID=A0A843XNF8_COLES|nr:hypothetical protein [Colocasia esculenta]
MTGFGSPCGACKFLRRKCVRGCVFAPYFCHEQGAAHFAAIHKVFGASNVSKLLMHLPVPDRCEAAVTISYEAQARLQDPVYGCVAHIFALQQQVVNLQAQLASLKSQAAQCHPNGVSAAAADPTGGKLSNRFSLYQQDALQGCFHGGDDDVKLLQLPLTSNPPVNGEDTSYYGSRMAADLTCLQPSMAYAADMANEHFSYGSGDGSCAMNPMNNTQMNARKSSYQDMDDDLQSLAFAYLQHS